jgi:hypothetical protein
VRENAIAALVTNLKASAAINSVIRLDDKETLARPAYPAVMVVDDGLETRYPLTGGYADVYFIVRLIGRVRGKEQSSLMNTLDAAINAVVSADRTLGGIVANVTIMPRENTVLDGNEEDTNFTRPVRVYYLANESLGD